MTKFVFGQYFLNQSVGMSEVVQHNAILRCSVHCMIS